MESPAHARGSAIHPHMHRIIEIIIPDTYFANANYWIDLAILVAKTNTERRWKIF